MKTRYRKFLWIIVRIFLNRILKRISENRALTDLKIMEPDWKNKTVVIRCTEVSRHLIGLFPEKMLGFKFTGRIVEKIDG